ncbi:Verrucotoxin subunit beta [Acipenser ruthenus]|uniref:Verrucotoxin subunit beta n=1 Tax=Acipenser ruthenus TaxID=7906 RepID=A0A444V5W0_ACIRT|nr:Verrucotoxin subunit beta [Acipenser ruthenus]
MFVCVTLWDREVLIKDLDVHAKPNTEFKITSSDSIKEKLSLLDVSASLKASFLAGLVEVGGSAKYLNNMTSSKRQCRVTMHYSTTNRFEQLTMSQLGKMVYPQVFEQQTATHIIMAVLYGAQAFFVFDQMASEEKTKQLIEGNLNVMVKKIPNFSIEGKGALKMTDKDKESVQKFSCTFHGDFEIKHNPTTYLEALDVYKTLPGLLGEKREKEVPVRVWLYPLEHLDSEAAKLVQEISWSLVSGAETVLEELNEVSMRCNDMTSDGFIRHFSDLKEKLYQFQGLFLQYKPVFQKALSRLLPSIKGGRLEEQVLADVLQSHKQSPFSSHLLEKWLNEKESEIDILRLYTDTMKDIPIMSSEGQLNKVLFDPKIDTVICFTFTSLFYDEPYLTVLMQYLHSEEFKKLQKLTNFIKNVETQPWFTSSTLSATMRVNLESFRGFAEANKDDKKTSFLIASVSDRSCPGASIYLYCRGKLMNPQFQPVSKPNPPVSTDTQPDRVTLKLLPSQTGETERYRVEYRAVQRGAQTEGQWTVTDTPDTQGTWTLSGLQAGTLYQIRYRSVSAVGVSEASEAIEIQTKPNPRGPEELSIKRVGLQAVQVTWKEPASEEERRSVLRYRVEYKNDRWEEWVAKLSKPGECVCTLVGLKYSNLYRVRVSAVFTEAETSATSQEAEVPPMQGKRIGFVSE